jgi:hypothetical protein
LHEQLVDIAPTPIVARLEAPDDGVLGLVKVFGRVRVRRIVAAADVPADQAQPQMNPGAVDREAFLAAVRGSRGHVPDLVEMPARRHDSTRCKTAAAINDGVIL